MPEQPAPRECAWPRCHEPVLDRRRRWCDEHQEPGRKLSKQETNKGYYAQQSSLADMALAPDALAHGGRLLRAPLVQDLRKANRRLDAAVEEYDRSVRAFGGYSLHGDLEGWAELKVEHEQRLRFAVTELRNASRDATEAFRIAIGW